MDQETTHQNWFQREGNAMKSMCLGFIMVIVCSGGIFWNEQNYVLQQATADVIGKAAVVDGCVPLSADDGKLIFAACSVTAPDMAQQLPDALRAFVPEFNGSSLTWSTEIYQWVQSSSKSCQKDNNGGETCTTTYSYDQQFVDHTNPSYGGNYQNFGTMPFNAKGDHTAPEYSVVLSGKAGETTNGFALDDDLQGQMPSNDVVPKKPSNTTLVEQYRGNQGDGTLTAGMLHIQDKYLMTGSGTNIGDLRISISGRSADQASICAKQTNAVAGGSTKVTAWPPEKFDMWGRKTLDLEYLLSGIYTKDDFKSEIKSENTKVAYILRLGLFIGMILAFNCIFSPLSVAADLLRFLNYCTCCLGSILDGAAQTVISLVSCMSACWCFTFIFTIAWLYANPTYAVVGAIIMVAISAIGVFAGMSMKKKKADARAPTIATEYMKLGKDGKAPFLIPV